MMNETGSKGTMDSVKAMRGSASIEQRDDAAELRAATDRLQRERNIQIYRKRVQNGIDLFSDEEIFG